MAEMTPAQVLDLPMGPNDANAATVRDYLIEVLRLAWRDEADYDGKRPFGNSGWQWDVYGALADALVVPSARDEFGELDLDTREADAILDAAILALGEAPRG